MLPRIIRTSRLVLRPPLLEDAPAIFKGYGQDPEVTRYLTWQPKSRVEEMEDFLRGCVSAWQGEDRRPWVLTRAPEDVALGIVNLWLEDHRAELGYVLARSAWGQGLMSEAVQVVTELALAEPGIYRVAAYCDVENMGSARVLEKAGMVREGLLRRCVMHPNVCDEPGTYSSTPGRARRRPRLTAPCRGAQRRPAFHPRPP